MTQELDPTSLIWSRAMALYAQDRTCQANGIVVSDIAAGWARVQMRVDEAMVNPHGTVHGGYLFLLADTAFAFACNTRGPAVAAGADVEFLAPVHEGDELVATALERVVRGRRGVYDVTVRRGQEPVAEFRGRSRTVPGPTP